MYKLVKLGDIYSSSKVISKQAYIIETRNGYYLQSFKTIVAYYSKTTGKLYWCWLDKNDGCYLVSRSTIVHFNWFNDYLGLKRQCTRTIEKLPYKNVKIETI